MLDLSALLDCEKAERLYDLQVSMIPLARAAMQSTAEKTNSRKERSSFMPRDFIWDRYVKYISTTLLGLTVVSFTLEYLTGGGVYCYPADTA